MLNTEPQATTPEIHIQSEPLVVLSEAAAGKLHELVARTRKWVCACTCTAAVAPASATA